MKWYKETKNHVKSRSFRNCDKTGKVMKKDLVQNRIKESNEMLTVKIDHDETIKNMLLLNIVWPKFRFYKHRGSVAVAIKFQHSIANHWMC